MPKYYASLSADGRIVAEYPVEGSSLPAVARKVAADLGAGWPDIPMPATCFVKLRNMDDWLLYHQEHSLPDGRPTLNLSWGRHV